MGYNPHGVTIMTRLLAAGVCVGLILAGGCRSRVVHMVGVSNDIMGDVVLQSVHQDVIGVAVWRDGRLWGAEGLDQETSGWEWTRERELVDHPRLSEWRQAVAELDARIRDGGGSAGEVVTLARPLPFDSLVGKKLLDWVGGDGARAADVMDLADGLDMHDRARARLVEVALTAPDLSDARLAAWSGLEAVQENEDAVLALSRSEAAGPMTLRILLQHVDEVRSSRRREVFETAGRRLVRDPAEAWLLAGQLEELTGDDRAETALALLANDGASPDYALQLLERLDDFYGDDRPQVYLAAARAACTDPRARGILVARLDDLYGNDRADAAVRLLSWPEAGPELAASLVAHLDVFYGSDAERVLLAVIDSPAFIGTIPRAVIRVASAELHGARRRNVLKTLIAHPATPAPDRRLAQDLLDHR
jgi:hypothetical protein